MSYQTCTQLWLLYCYAPIQVRRSFWCTGCCLLYLWHFGSVHSAPPIRYQVLAWESIPVRLAFTGNLMWCMLETTSKLAHSLKLGFWPAATFWLLNDDWVPLKHQATVFMALTFSGLTSVVFCNRTPVIPSTVMWGTSLCFEALSWKKSTLHALTPVKCQPSLTGCLSVGVGGRLQKELAHEVQSKK